MPFEPKPHIFQTRGDELPSLPREMRRFTFQVCRPVSTPRLPRPRFLTCEPPREAAPLHRPVPGARGARRWCTRCPSVVRAMPIGGAQCPGARGARRRLTRSGRPISFWGKPRVWHATSGFHALQCVSTPLTAPRPGPVTWVPDAGAPGSQHPRPSPPLQCRPPVFRAHTHQPQENLFLVP